MADSKIFILAQHQKRAILQTKIVSIILVCLALFVVFSAFLGWKNYENQNLNSQKYQEKSRQDWLNNPDKNPHRMAHFGNYAFRKNTPLSILESGMSSYFGNVIYLEAHKQNATNFSEANFSNGLMRFGKISVGLILQIILPLILCFIGFSVVASERENGTLKLLVTQGVSWKQILLGKILGLTEILLLFYIPVVLILFTIWCAAQNWTTTVDDSLKMILFFGFHFMYLLFFCVIIVLISASSKTNKTALISCIGFWLMLVVILPKGTQALGNYWYQSPTKPAFFSTIEKDILKEGDSHNPNDVRFKHIKDSLLLVYKVDSIHKIPFNYSGFLMTEGEKISSRIYDKNQENLWQIFEKQNSFYNNAAIINPYIAIKNLAMALSNTDYDSYKDFQNQAESNRYLMAQKLNSLQVKFISNIKQKPTDKPFSISHKHWHDVVDFNFDQKEIIAVLQQQIFAIVSLLFWIIFLFVLIETAHKNLKAL